MHIFEKLKSTFVNPSKKIPEVLKALFIVLVIILAFKLSLPIITSDKFRAFVEGIGIWGYLIFIGYIVLSHVLAPVAGSPIVFLGVSIYGISTSMYLIYIASLISASINFYISKRFGRKWVTRLVGKNAMREIDQFVAAEGKEALILGRLFGFGLFDFISYAAGLTKIAYKPYILITAIVAFIPNTIARYAYRNIDLTSEKGIAIWIGSIWLTVAVFGLVIKRYLRARNQLSRAKSLR